MHLKKDPFTTARTWCIKPGEGVALPWAVRSAVALDVTPHGECAAGRASEPIAANAGRQP